MRVPMTLHTWTGDHKAVVLVDVDGRVTKVLLTRDGESRDITDRIDDDVMATIEAQLLALGDDALDLDGVVDEERHETGAPDEADLVSREWEQDRMREASE